MCLALVGTLESCQSEQSQDSMAATRLRIEARVMDHRVPEIVGRDPTGTAWTHAFPAARPALIFLYREDCGACARTQDAWRALADAGASRADIISATFAPAADVPYLAHPLVHDVRVQDGREFRRFFGVADVVPITVLVNGQGFPIKARLGVLRQSDIEEFARALENERVETRTPSPGATGRAR
jgi:hypothetical protein